MSVEDWRRKIDEIDRKLVELLNERSQCVLEIGRIKKVDGIGALPARSRAAGPGGGGASQSRPAERGGHPAVIRAHSGRSAVGGAHGDARRGDESDAGDSPNGAGSRRRIISARSRGESMVVVMQAEASEEQIQHVIDRLVALGFDIHRSTGASHTVLGAVGVRPDFDTRDIEVLPGVREVVRITQPYKLASRAFRPEGTVVELPERRAHRRDGSRRRGGPVRGGIGRADRIRSPSAWPHWARGFCAAARSSRAASPYSFQGLGEPGLAPAARGGRQQRSAGGQRSDGPVADCADAAVRGSSASRRAKHAELSPAARAGRRSRSPCC